MCFKIICYSSTRFRFYVIPPAHSLRKPPSRTILFHPLGGAPLRLLHAWAASYGRLWPRIQHPALLSKICWRCVPPTSSPLRSLSPSLSPCTFNLHFPRYRHRPSARARVAQSAPSCQLTGNRIPPDRRPSKLFGSGSLRFESLKARSRCACA